MVVSGAGAMIFDRVAGIRKNTHPYEEWNV